MAGLLCRLEQHLPVADHRPLVGGTGVGEDGEGGEFYGTQETSLRVPKLVAVGTIGVSVLNGNLNLALGYRYGQYKSTSGVIMTFFQLCEVFCFAGCEQNPIPISVKCGDDVFVPTPKL